MVQDVGNAITIVGIVVTLVAYFGQHSGVSFADLEPNVVARWHRSRTWVLKRLGRHRPITARLNAVMESNVTLSARAMAWSPIQPGDDIAVRVDKLAQNLDRVLDEVKDVRSDGSKKLRETDQRLTERLNELDHRVVSQQEESRRTQTAAMRWEVRGLLITLVGAGLGILG